MKLPGTTTVNAMDVQSRWFGHDNNVTTSSTTDSLSL